MKMPSLLAPLLVVLAISCGDEADEPVAEGRSQIALLDEPLVPGDMSAAPDALEQLLARDEIWVLDEPLPEKMWRPEKGAKGVLAFKLRFPVAGGPWRFHGDRDLTRASMQPLQREDTRPRAGELTLEQNLLRRAESYGVPATTELDYPTTRAALNVFASPRNTDGSVAPLQLRLGSVSRRTLLTPAPSEHSYQVRLPAEAHLDFAVALRRTEILPTEQGIRLRLGEQGSVRFRVLLEVEDGTREELWSASLGADDRERFEEVSLDLARWSTEFVRLHFETSPEVATDGADWSMFAAWGEPLVWSAAATPRPNIIVVLLDTLRADRVGCYGWERARTPHLDALAERGVRYADAMSAASWTLPAHASLFTSSYPSQHGLWDDQRLPAALTTVAEALQAGGYQTAAIAERGFLKESHGFARGFQSFDSVRRECTVTFERAAQWIEERRAPYFAFVHTYKVHSPYEPSAEFSAGFVREYDGDLPAAVEVRDYDWGRNGPPPSAADVRYVSDLYDAEVAEVDAALGQFIARLEAAGALENTLLVVTSDHGEEFFDHGAALHGMSLYQEQLHIPLIVYWKGHFEGGEVVSQPVHLVDVAPTLVAAARVEVPGNWVGEVLGGTPGESGRPLFVPMRTRWAKSKDKGVQAIAIREGSLKYIDYPTIQRKHDEQGGAGLFDLARDPLERSNLLDPATALEWQAKARALRERYGQLGNAESFEVDEAALRELEELGYVGED